MNIDELEKLAEKAVGYRWPVRFQMGNIGTDKDGFPAYVTTMSGMPMPNADLISSLNPQTVLKLIAVVRAAKLIEYQEKTYGCEDMTYAPVMYDLRKALAALEEK